MIDAAQTGVVREGVRLSYGVIGRLPRVVPDPGAEFNGYFLPAGVGFTDSLVFEYVADFHYYPSCSRL